MLNSAVDFHLDPSRSPTLDSHSLASSSLVLILHLHLLNLHDPHPILPLPPLLCQLYFFLSFSLFLFLLYFFFCLPFILFFGLIPLFCPPSLDTRFRLLNSFRPFPSQPTRPVRPFLFHRHPCRARRPQIFRILVRLPFCPLFLAFLPIPLRTPAIFSRLTPIVSLPSIRSRGQRFDLLRLCTRYPTSRARPVMVGSE